MLRVKELAKEKGLNVADVANRMGIKPPALSRIINGSNTTTETLQKIADALDVDIRELFAGSCNSLNGFIEYKGEIHRINSKSDLENLLKLME